MGNKSSHSVSSLTARVEAVERAVKRRAKEEDVSGSASEDETAVGDLRALEEILCGRSNADAPEISLCNRLSDILSSRGTPLILLDRLHVQSLEMQKLIGRVFVALVRYDYGSFNSATTLRDPAAYAKRLLTGYDTDDVVVVVSGEMFRECVALDGFMETLIEQTATKEDDGGGGGGGWWWRLFVVTYMHRKDLAAQLDAVKSFTAIARSDAFHDQYLLRSPDVARNFFDTYHEHLTYAADEAVACDSFDLLDNLLRLWRSRASPLVARYLGDPKNLKRVLLGLFREPVPTKIAALRVFGQFVVGLRSAHVASPADPTRALCCGGRLDRYHEAPEVHAMLAQNREVILTQLFKFDAGDDGGRREEEEEEEGEEREEEQRGKKKREGEEMISSSSSSRTRTAACARWLCWRCLASASSRADVVEEARALQGAIVRLREGGEGDRKDFERLVQRLVMVHLRMMRPGRRRGTKEEADEAKEDALERAKVLVKMGRAIARGGDGNIGDERRSGECSPLGEWVAWAGDCCA